MSLILVHYSGSTGFLFKKHFFAFNNGSKNKSSDMATHTLKEKMCKRAFPLHFLLGEGNKKSYSEAVKSSRENKASSLRC